MRAFSLAGRILTSWRAGGVRKQTSSGGPRGRPRSVRNLLAPSSAGTSARRADGRMGLCGGGLRWAMGLGRAQAEVEKVNLGNNVQR